MRNYFGAILTMALSLVPFGPARADDVDAKSILDKAIKALGGDEKLAKVAAYSWKSEGTVTFNGNENESKTEVTVKGLDHFRREFGNDNFHGVVVLAGDKGWRMFGDNSSELEGDALANEKRGVYLQVIPIKLVTLKEKGFKYETGGEEKVGDKPALILKITGPDGKDFTLSFDKENWPARQTGCQGARVPGQGVYRGDNLRRLQRLRRNQEGHQNRGQARWRDVSEDENHGIQAPRQGRARSLHRAK